MAVIQSRPSESSGDGYDRRQVYRVPTGLYGAMFSAYTKPKMYPVFQKPEEKEEKFFAFFVLTNQRDNSPLPHFSEAMTGVKTKDFYDPEKPDMTAKFVRLVYALLGGKTPMEEVSNGIREGAYDMDDYIGRPVLLWVKENTTVDKNGLWTNKVTSIEPVDTGMMAAMKPLWTGRKVESGDGESVMARLTHPVPAFADDVAVTSSVTESHPFGDELEDDEAPF